MRIGRTVAFVHNVSLTQEQALAADQHQLSGNKSIRLGQVKGILENGTAVGDVPESITEDGLNVQIDTLGTTVWLPRGQAHTIYTQADTDGLNKAIQKLLGVPIGSSVADLKKSISFAEADDPWGGKTLVGAQTDPFEEEDEFEEERRRRRRCQSQRHLMNLGDLKNTIAKEAFGITPDDAKAKGICIRCQKEAKPRCYSPAGLREYNNSGMCEFCFDLVTDTD